MELNNAKVLVTGSDGFIGSHLVEALIEKGAQVRAFVYYNSFNSWGWLEDLSVDQKSKIDVVLGDIRDPYGIKKAMIDCDIVFHLAALIGIPYSYYSPDSYVDTNVKGTLNVLQAARELGTKKIIHTSSSETYGTAQFVPITEEHPLVGQSPYAATKIAADQLALSFHKSFGTPVSVIRPFNTYGPRQSARAVIPTIIAQLLDGQDEIALGALEPTRDFTYVTDTAEGFLAVAESEKTIGDVTNIGSQFEISIGQVVEVISDVIGKKVRIRTDVDRQRPKNSEVERLYCDHTKAKTITGWDPKFASVDGFKEGIKKTVEWFSDRDNRLKYKATMMNV